MTNDEEKNGSSGDRKEVDIEDEPGMEEEVGIKEGSSGDESEPVIVEEVEAESVEREEGSDEKNISHDRNSGRKKSKKATRAEIADHLARKNEMLQELRDRLIETEKIVDAKEDRLIRLAAEFENYKKRTRREWELLKNQANAGLISEMLGILDDLDRAFEHSGDTGENFKEGISLIRTSLLELLKRNGLGEIEAKGKSFDPQYHEAVAEIHSEDIESGFVAEVVLKGYVLNDQVLRPAKVVVSKGSAE